MAKKFSADGATLTELLRKVVVYLNQEIDLVRGHIFHSLLGAMNERVNSLNLINVPELLMLMQELGLLRHRGGGKLHVWQVVDISFFDEIAEGQWLEKAQLCLVKYKEGLDELRALRVRVAQLESLSSAGSMKTMVAHAVGEKTMEEIAELVVESERLKAALIVSNAQVDDLRRELSERPTFDADAALAAAIKRARGQNAA